MICDELVLGSAMRLGGELEQIQFFLGHVSVQTTERYLGCKQRIRSAVNGRIRIESNPNQSAIQRRVADHTRRNLCRIRSFLHRVRGMLSCESDLRKTAPSLATALTEQSEIVRRRDDEGLSRK
ncbi:MAG: hypothetical protein DMG96_40805 [Acidobacteria bacterium]|nr:MAG: hypothetical protein DMG96_40805 [Acidobacteriota bacterium]